MKNSLEPKLSVYKSDLTVQQFRDRIPNRKHSIRDDIREIVEKTAFPIPRETGVVKLVALSLSELGFTHEPFLYEFLNERFLRNWSAQHLHRQCLVFSKPWDAVHLFLRHRNKDREYLMMGMVPVRVEKSDPVVFTLGRNVYRGYGIRWLHTHYANLNCLEAGPMKRGSGLENFIADVMETRYRLCDKWIFRLIDF